MQQVEYGIFGPVLSNKSPLHYPGGKARAWNKFKEFLPSNVTILVSPFCGGCAIELNCAVNNIDVIASDRVEPLINFWQQYQKDSNALMDQVIEWFPLSYEEGLVFYENQLQSGCKNIKGDILSDLERAAVYLLLNRQTFRGNTLTQKSQKKLHRDLNVDTFKKLKGLYNWYNPNITFIHSDYKDTIEEYEGQFMYFDPPYVDYEHVYGTKDDKKNKFDHKGFHDRIAALNNQWILSYKKHDLIMELYKDFRIIEYNFSHTHGSKGAKDVTELFILNL